jgi:hypothetical protein
MALVGSVHHVNVSPTLEGLYLMRAESLGIGVQQCNMFSDVSHPKIGDFWEPC